MPKYMLIHHKDSEFVSHHINHACKICARQKRVIWKRVYYNLKEGRIFCEWEAKDRETLQSILQECKIPCQEVVEVEEMIPEECTWDIFGELEE
jgi:hypothetical protein